MARPSKEPPSPSALLPALLALVHARGGEAALVAARAGVLGWDASRIVDEMPTTAKQLGAALDAACAALGEPFLALSLPDALASRKYGAAELVARASANVGDALTRIAGYAPLVFPQLEGSFDGARASFRVRGHPRGVGRAANEYFVAFALTIARRAAGRAVVPASVFFGHARPHDLAPLHRFFGTRAIELGAPESGFVLSREDAAAPAPTADARLLATAESMADTAMRAQPRASELSRAVAARVESTLDAGVEIEAVAASLHMSARTLQRRLDEEGTSFKEIIDGVREVRARELIADTTRPLGEIAFALGFADLATFSRAFKRWTGTPPGVWRRR